MIRRKVSVHFVSVLMWLVVSSALFAQESSVSFGQRQIDQVLADRPEMRGILRPQDEVWTRVEEMFQGKSGETRVYWDNREPVSGRAAGYHPPFRSYPPHIRVTADESVSGVDKWFMLVFELHNCEHHESVKALIQKAVRGDIDRDEFAIECVKLEFVAMTKTTHLFAEHPIAVARQTRDTRYVQWMSYSDDFSEYLQRLDDRNPEAYDPRKYFRSYFERVIPRQRKLRQFFLEHASGTDNS